MFARLNELGIFYRHSPRIAVGRSACNNRSMIWIMRSLTRLWGLPPQFDHLTHRQTLGYLIWLGALPPVTITAVASRLRFKADLRNLLLAASKLHQSLPGLAEARPSSPWCISVRACPSGWLFMPPTSPALTRISRSARNYGCMPASWVDIET